MYCANCGSEVKGKFCPKCGAGTGGASAPAASPVPAVSRADALPYSIRKTIGIILCSIALAGFIFPFANGRIEWGGESEEYPLGLVSMFSNTNEGGDTEYVSDETWISAGIFGLLYFFTFFALILVLIAVITDIIPKICGALLVLMPIVLVVASMFLGDFEKGFISDLADYGGIISSALSISVSVHLAAGFWISFLFSLGLAVVRFDRITALLPGGK